VFSQRGVEGDALFYWLVSFLLYPSFRGAVLAILPRANHAAGWLPGVSV